MAHRSLVLFLAALVLGVPAAVLQADFLPPDAYHLSPGQYVAVTPVYTLQDLISQQGSVQVGPVTFSGFGAQSTYDAGKPGLPPSLAGISVQGVCSNDPFFTDTYGLRFQGAWTAMGQQAINTLINYIASSQEKIFMDATLNMSSGAGAGSGMASIAEGLAAPGPLGELTPLFAYDWDGGTQVSDSEKLGVQEPGFVLNSYPGTYNPGPTYGPDYVVVRQSVVVSGGGTGVATIGEFVNAFHVATPVPAPEPATLSVLAVGALGLMRRSRQ